MPIYEFAPDRIQPLSKTTFGAMQLHERRDLQRLLRENIEVIAEEYGQWDESVASIFSGLIVMPTSSSSN